MFSCICLLILVTGVNHLYHKNHKNIFYIDSIDFDLIYSWLYSSSNSHLKCPPSFKEIILESKLMGNSLIEAFDVLVEQNKVSNSKKLQRINFLKVMKFRIFLISSLVIFLRYFSCSLLDVNYAGFYLYIDLLLMVTAHLVLVFFFYIY